MRAIALALLIGCTACAHTQVSVNSNARTSNTLASGVQVSGSGTFAAVSVAAFLAAAAAEGSREAPTDRSSAFADWSWSRPAPEMHPDRVIQEQDCTKPMEVAGNLRCK
jgi:hypothetical protein